MKKVSKWFIVRKPYANTDLYNVTVCDSEEQVNLYNRGENVVAVIPAEWEEED